MMLRLFRNNVFVICFFSGHSTAREMANTTPSQSREEGEETIVDT